MSSRVASELALMAERAFRNESKMREALEKIAAMDPNGIRADGLGRAARIAREAIGVVGTPLAPEGGK